MAQILHCMYKLDDWRYRTGQVVLNIYVENSPK